MLQVHCYAPHSATAFHEYAHWHQAMQGPVALDIPMDRKRWTLDSEGLALSVRPRLHCGPCLGLTYYCGEYLPVVL